MVLMLMLMMIAEPPPGTATRCSGSAGGALGRACEESPCNYLKNGLRLALIRSLSFISRAPPHPLPPSTLLHTPAAQGDEARHTSRACLPPTCLVRRTRARELV